MVTVRYRGSRGGRLRLKSNKGVAFIWFTLMTLPIILFFCALTIDAGRIYMTNRQAGNLVESAALAGVQSDVVDLGGKFAVTSRFEAEQRINQMITTGLASNALTGVKPNVITEIFWGINDDMVRVTLQYEMSGLVFDRLWGYQDLNYSAKAVGYICAPGDESVPSNGYCSRTIQ